MASALDASELFGGYYENLRCRVRITGVDEPAVTVASYQVREGLSQLFSYRLEVSTDVDDVESLEDALGAEATVVLERDNRVDRIAHGIVTEVLPDGAYVTNRQARTVVVIEPRLANLRYSGGMRIFQDQSLPDIIASLVAPENIEVEWRTYDDPIKRNYRTQLDESDLDFLLRLAADEGFHFFFEHDDEKTKLVFTNDARSFRELDGGSVFDFRDIEGAVSEEHVRSIRRAARVRTGAVEHRDYNFEEPRIKLVARSEPPDPQNESNTARRERRDYPGGFVDPDGEGARRARRRLEELRSDARTFEGTAYTLRFAAGRRFTLRGHRQKAFNQELVLCAIEVSGEAKGGPLRSDGIPTPRVSAEACVFRAVPWGTPIHPARRPKPAARLQTALVVGPVDGDPYVDKHGRIKVQFYWDRDGTFDEHSSCWIRMMTPNAHAGEGFYIPHKVGSEVLVDFIDGDIDRPVVLGALYNVSEPHAYKQPDEVAHSSWKVRSIPGRDGYNEIAFQNTAGKENILTHAQRNRTAKVLHADSETIGASQTTTIGGPQTITVGAERTVTVGASETISVTKERHETVGATEDVTIAKGRAHTVQEGGDALHLPKGDRTITLDDGNHVTSVAHTTSLETDDATTHARKTINVTGDDKIVVTQGQTTATMEAGNVDLVAAGRVRLTHKGTSILVDDAGKVTVTAEPELEVNCQGAQIKMGAGKIAMNAPTEITLAVGQSGVKISGTGVEMSGPNMKSTALEGINEISGLAVKLN